MRRVIYLSIAIAVFISCSPKVKVNSLVQESKSVASYPYEPFAIVTLDTVVFDGARLLGNIEIKDSGFSIICDYETVKQLAKKSALELGGNCMVITEHKPPSASSTCHRIKADVYRINNPEDYEQEVYWHPKRKLKIGDFKGDTLNRPFQAATYATFDYYLQSKALFSKNYVITVNTKFDCGLSYFKLSHADAKLLEHEQIHFDIAELYARKFLKRMQEETLDVNDAIAKHNIISSEVFRELQLKQDEYDSEVYSDNSMQNKWVKWIENEIENSAQFENKTATVYKK